MNNILEDFPNGFPPSQPLPPIKVVLIYESLAAALRAKHLVDRVAGTFRDEFIFATEVWSFEMLQYSALRDVALREVAEANLLVISGENEAQFPAEVISVISAGHSPERDRPAGVVVLWSEGEKGTETPIDRFRLRSVLEQKGMDFLTDGSESGAEQGEVEISAFRCRSSNPSSPTNRQVRESIVDTRWGINE